MNSLQQEIATFIASFSSLSLTLGVDIFYDIAPVNSRNDSTRRTIVGVMLADSGETAKQNEKVASGATLYIPAVSGEVSEGFPMLQEIDEVVVTKKRVMQRVRVFATATRPAQAFEKMEEIDRRINTFGTEPPSTLVSGGEWDVAYIRREGELDTASPDDSEKTAVSGVYMVAAFRRYS